MSREPLFRENRPGKEFGVDVTLTIHWVRHAQKLSGEVLNADKTDMSSSSLSPRGAVDAEALGRTLPVSKDGVKGFVSVGQPRTRETVQNIFTGYQAAHPDTEVRPSIQERERLLPVLMDQRFLELYDEKLTANKKALLEAAGHTLADFGNLSSDDQMRIAEAAEEPIVREWLDDPTSEMAQCVPPRVAAADFAQLFVSENRTARFAKPGTEIDFVNATHKTVTEPFLVSGVLLRRPVGERITKLEQLGGALEPLGNWTSQVYLDADGQPKLTVRLRGQEYDVDMDVLQQLNEEGKSLAQTESAR